MQVCVLRSAQGARYSGVGIQQACTPKPSVAAPCSPGTQSLGRLVSRTYCLPARPGIVTPGSVNPQRGQMLVVNRPLGFLPVVDQVQDSVQSWSGIRYISQQGLGGICSLTAVPTHADMACVSVSRQRRSGGGWHFCAA